MLGAFVKARLVIAPESVFFDIYQNYLNTTIDYEQRVIQKLTFAQARVVASQQLIQHQQAWKSFFEFDNSTK